MENILKDEWLKGNIVPREFMFRFNNKRLVMYNINYDRYDDNKIIFGLCVNLVNNLIEKGMITFFPSWLIHDVTPVTQGTRYSLVGWVNGPNFK